MAIASVIKYEGDNSTFIWKHPREDFKIGTQLIVHESQEAVFFMDGQALDLFGPGRHTLQTENLPLIGKYLDRNFDEKTAFHCEVYYINKVEQMAIRWGTDSKVEFMEPTYKFPIQIGASGEMSLRADDSRKLLIKLAGTEKALNQQKIVQSFRAILMTRVKTYFASLIKEKHISVFEIDEHLEEISDELKAKLFVDFKDYGVALEKFFVTTVVKPDGEPEYEKFKSLHFRQYADIAEAKLQQQLGIIDAETKAQRTIIESKATAQKREQEGYTYQQERGFDVAQDVAKNEASGQFTNMGVGLGTMTGVGGVIGGVVGGAVGGAFASTESQSGAKCAKCGTALPQNAKFCLECGEKVVVAQPATVVCPACGKTVLKGKFCPECGYKFVSATCPKCGTAVPEGAKFCLECGEKF
ncbi:MAG: SPFH domain-containing protein [Clostridia bacterium]|nr:SPFH domain-containing protein [Clostridia bacterium]